MPAMANPRREEKRARSDAARAARLREARRKRQIKTAAIIGALALLLTSLGVASTVSSDDKPTTDTTQAAAGTPPTAPPVPAGESIKGATPCPPAEGAPRRVSSFEQAPTMCIVPGKKYTADFDTTEGHIFVDLDTTKTPGVANNFVVLSRYKYYDGSSIVRTNTGIDIIQGGAPTTQTNGDPGPGYNIKDEGGPFTYKEGDLVMANTGQPNSSGAQFFFGSGPKVAQLDGQGTYLNFGKTSGGLDVLKKIAALHQPSDPSEATEGAPSKVVIINKITITEPA